MNRFFKSLIFIFLFLGVTIAWFLNSHRFKFDEASNHCRSTQFHIENSGGEVIFGAEDIEIDTENGLAFISAFNPALNDLEMAAGEDISQGGMYVWDLNAYPPSSEQIVVGDISTNIRNEIEFRPHGISMLKGDDWWRFFVVNHAYPLVNGTPEHVGQVLILDYLNGQLVVDEAISASIMCSPNDVVNLGPKNFLVTNDHGTCVASERFSEEVIAAKVSYLLYWDGDTMRQVAGGFAYANGITTSPNDMGKTYLATTREEKIYVFDTDVLISGGVHKPIDSIEVPFSPDNFSWDIDGRLVVAGFPNIYSLVASRMNLFGVEVTPAAAMAIDEREPHTEQEILFNNDTGMMRGATVAAIYDNYTIATSVFDDNILICDNSLNTL
jgi:arylesterase/paraoxonase